jgi:hypothetical protein
MLNNIQKEKVFMPTFFSIKNNAVTFLFTKYCVLWLLLSVFWSGQLSAKEFNTIDWVDLIPQADLDILLNPPQAISAIPDGAEEDVLWDSLSDAVENAITDTQIPLSPEDQAYYSALKSTNIKAEFNNQNIRIPGFIVPVEYGEDQLITEFFLVPYFGACIHYPPPPPNQIIYVKYPQGLLLDALYDPFWIEGQLSTEIIENDLATSAYALAALNIKPYKEFQN